MSQKIEIVPITIERHAQVLFDWRRNVEISRHMYSEGPQSFDEHLRWLKSIAQDVTHKRFAVEQGGKPVGTTALVNVNEKHSRADFDMYIGEASARIRGAGAVAEFLTLEYGFHRMKLHKISCEVFAGNSVAIRLHERMGFSLEGVFREHALFEGEWVDVTRLSLLSEDWQKCREKLKRLLAAMH
ncbi:UDP-4-amino-4,6-dideoxy-N-acetyl-beta-L-altrosamine N-acetyltransferase [bacterium]|nr:UDP-4-amino-4,6-dideoxy-N-acetyl-beta-L-altrosamine N-acetyltransferase [bacterium]MDB4603801.1 UDP-4-amino-4,6-dideoxy-N-acetyl-beta-L-altrosamine N-acetyltransferase [bacterium]